MAKLPEGSGFFFNYIMVLGPLLMLVTPWALFASMMLWLDIMKIDAEMHRWFFSLSLVSFSIFFWSFASTAWRVIKVSDRIAGCSLALTFPFYFILHSIAAVMALYKVFTYPYYWEKTEHGVSRIKNIFSKKKY
jgi:hypothetical protein